MYNAKGELIGHTEFDEINESTGTLKFFNIIQDILNILEYGGVFVVDELTNRMHPLLAKFIIELFQSEMNKKAQLIFTTHEVTLMNNKSMRRDEIVLVEKNKYGESTINSLADFKIRSDATFQKDYLAGKYGAIPVTKKEANNEAK